MCTTLSIILFFGEKRNQNLADKSIISKNNFKVLHIPINRLKLNKKVIHNVNKIINYLTTILCS